MARKRFSAEQIIIKLREAEVGLAQEKLRGASRPLRLGTVRVFSREKWLIRG